MRRPDDTPQTLRSELGQSSDLERFLDGPSVEIEARELAHRITVCARLLDAWPNARPLNRDRTLIEYVNATRGVPAGRLERCIQLAIDAGGDWLPPAGEVIKRAAVQGLGGPVVGTDRDALFWHEKKIAATVARYREFASYITPLNPDEPLPMGSKAKQISG